MRTLKFIVDKQVILQDPECDFTGLAPGSEDFLEAEFTFSEEWSGCVKVASFWSVFGEEYEPQPIDDEGKCKVPTEAAAKRVFKVAVLGRNSQYKITTNKLEVAQRGGCE